MEGLFNAKLKAEEERKERIRQQFTGNKAFGFGMLAGGGIRGLTGNQTPQERMANKIDIAKAGIAAPAGSAEYFQQLAQNLDKMGLRDSAAQAMAKANEVSKAKLAFDTDQRAFADVNTRRELAQSVSGNIQQDPGNWFKNYANALQQAGLIGDAEKALETARKYKVKNESLKDYIGLDDATIRKLYSPESVRDANLARINGAGRAEVVGILQKGAKSGAAATLGDSSITDLVGLIDGPLLENMNAASRQAILKAQGEALATGNPTALFEAMQTAVYEDEEAKKMAVSLLEESDAAAKAAESELRTLRQMRKRVKGAITGTFAPTRVGIKTAFASLGFAGADTLDELADTNVFLSQLGNLVLDRIKTLGTNPSNADRDFLVAMLPNITQNPESIYEILDYMIERTEGTQKKAKEVQEWYTEQESKGFQSYQLPRVWSELKNIEGAGITIDAKDIKVPSPTTELQATNPEFFVDGKLLSNEELAPLLQSGDYSTKVKEQIIKIIQERKGVSEND